jgi:hypothetical protein
MIGRHFSDPLLQEDMKHWPFTVKAAAGDKPMIEVQYKGEAKTFSPEEISSMVLVKMRDTASAYIGKVSSSKLKHPTASSACVVVLVLACSASAQPQHPWAGSGASPAYSCLVILVCSLLYCAWCVWFCGLVLQQQV